MVAGRHAHRVHLGPRRDLSAARHVPGYRRGRTAHAPHGSLQGITWSPDSKQIAFTQLIPDEDPILKVDLPKRPRGAEWAKPAVIVDRLTWARDGTGPVEKGYTHVFIVDAVLGGTPRQISEGKFNHGDPAWSSDGKTMYVSGIRKADAQYQRGDSEIYAIDLATREIRTLTDRKGPDANPTVSPDGQLSPTRATTTRTSRTRCPTCT